MGTFEEIDLRLRRIEGQVGGILRMHEAGRTCDELLDQISAARAALDSVAVLILREHVAGWLQAGREQHGTDELIAPFSRLVRGL